MLDGILSRPAFLFWRWFIFFYRLIFAYDEAKAIQPALTIVILVYFATTRLIIAEHIVVHADDELVRSNLLDTPLAKALTEVNFNEIDSIVCDQPKSTDL